MKTPDYLRAYVELRAIRHELADLRRLLGSVQHARYMGWGGVMATGTSPWALAQLEAAGYRVKQCYYRPAILLRTSSSITR